MKNMKNNKQNKNNSIIKRIIVFMIAVFAFVLFTVPSFAYTDNSTNNVDFENQPIPNATYLGNSSDTYNARFVFGNENTYQYSVCATGADDIYCAGYFTNSNHTTYYVLCASRTTGCSFTTCVDYGAGSYTISSQHRDMTSTYNNLYYKISSGTYNANTVVPSLPMFESLNDALDAINDWIDNPPAPAPSAHPLQFTLPAGNIFIANVSGTETSILLGMHTPLLSWNPPVSQYMGFFSTIPSDLSIPISGTTPIDWQKAGKKDILGRTSNWVADSYVSNQNFVIITNPLNQDASQYSSNSNNLEVSAANADITINMSSVIEYRVYSLSQQFNISTGDWNVSQGEQSFSGNYDETSQTWVTTDDATGNVSNPSYGGDNTPVVPNSISDWLENIASSISGFFTGAIGAVSNLVSAGSNFINSLQGLYSWLPPQVFSVLASALIIVITIGVIKVFI